MQESIVIYGKNGQLASALAENAHASAIVFPSSEYDFSNIENIKQALGPINASVIINATAYTDVNKAEIEEDLAYKANALIPAALAQYCLENDMLFIHYSTDYVFAGTGDKPHKETDPVAPLNAYGRTKLAGEEKIKQIGGKYIIFRTSWVYDHVRKNFLTAMLKLAAQNETMRVINDQFGAPTYAPHLAKASLLIIDKILQQGNFLSGVYHLCNSGKTSWYGFAMAIFKQAQENGIALKVQQTLPISSDEFVTPAKRPNNSRLDCTAIEQAFNVIMPAWEDGLKEAMGKLVDDSLALGRGHAC